METHSQKKQAHNHQKSNILKYSRMDDAGVLDSINQCVDVIFSNVFQQTYYVVLIKQLQILLYLTYFYISLLDNANSVIPPGG